MRPTKEMPPFNKPPRPTRRAPRRAEAAPGIAWNATEARSVFGKPTRLDTLAAKMLLPYGAEKQLPEGTVIRDMSPRTIVLNNKYLLEKPSELFLSGKFNAAEHIKEDLLDFETVLSGAYERSAVEAPLKLGMYGIAKAQKMFIDCMLDILYKDMPEKDVRERAETAAKALARKPEGVAAVLDADFVSVPAELGLSGLARYRHLLTTIVRAAKAAEDAAKAVAKAAENAAKAARNAAKKAEVNAFVRRYMEPRPAAKPAAPPPSSPRRPNRGTFKWPRRCSFLRASWRAARGNKNDRVR